MNSVLHDRHSERQRSIATSLLLVICIGIFSAASAALGALAGRRVFDFAPCVIVLATVVIFTSVALRVIPTGLLFANASGVSFSAEGSTLPWSALRALRYRASVARLPAELTVTIRAVHGDVSVRMVPARWLARKLRHNERDPQEVLREALGGPGVERGEPDARELARLELQVFQGSARRAAAVGGVSLLISTAWFVWLSRALDVTSFLPAVALGALVALVPVAMLVFVSRSTAIMVDTRHWIGVELDQLGRLARAGSAIGSIASRVLKPILPPGAHLTAVPRAAAEVASNLDSPYRTDGEAASADPRPSVWRPRLLIQGCATRDEALGPPDP